MSKIISLAKRFVHSAQSHQRGWKSVFWNTMIADMKRTGPLLTPVHVTIEPTNICNAKCPVCETGKGEMNRPRGMIDVIAFKKFVDDNWRCVNTIFFYFMGEPFLHKNAYEMIRYARNKGIFVETCTNGDFMDAEGTIYSDINVVNIQVGGMDNATHGIYRAGSNFEKVKRNLELLIEVRGRYPDSNVEITLGFIVMKHNEHQIDTFQRWGKELGVDKVQVIAPCVRTVEEGKIFLPENRQYWIYDEPSFHQGKLRPLSSPSNSCPWLWNTLAINWNGDAVACCRDPLGTNVLGNVFDQGLPRVFNGQKAQAFRKAVLDQQSSLSICRLCPGEGVPELKPTVFPNIKV